MNENASASTTNFFNRDMANAYDKRNSGLLPISDCLHFLMRLVVKDIPERARILCIGVGTGAEILSLAAAHPRWTFVGVDPSAEMLEVCHRRLEEAEIADRCELIHGYVGDVAQGGFDAVVSLLVAHFVKRADRPTFYREIHRRLRAGGRFISAEISADLNGPEFLGALRDWKQVQALMGATEESLASLEDMMRNVLAVLPADATQTLWREAGFPTPVSFFQAFMIRGWHADKPIR